mmetsp:Transcript_21322/g.27593  ORF Transcript_21322/g.27593 Transcript_21322/m.27593 type:complete len:206 (+) Transcript_21322:1410-2027(+)
MNALTILLRDHKPHPNQQLSSKSTTTLGHNLIIQLDSYLLVPSDKLMQNALPNHINHSCHLNNKSNNTTNSNTHSNTHSSNRTLRPHRIIQINFHIFTSSIRIFRTNNSTSHLLVPIIQVVKPGHNNSNNPMDTHNNSLMDIRRINLILVKCFREILQHLTAVVLQDILPSEVVCCYALIVFALSIIHNFQIIILFYRQILSFSN